MILGITGTTGAGKTTLLREMERRGAYIIDCDALYHQLLQQEGPLCLALREAFPEAFLDGCTLDRRRLARWVFSRPEELHRLDAIVAEHLPAEVERRIALQESKRWIGIDAIKLLESGLGRLCRYTVAVLAPEEKRLKRVMQRDGLSCEEALRRIQAQHNDDYYRERCDLVLENDCASAEEFRQKAAQFLNKLEQEEKHEQ